MKANMNMNANMNVTLHVRVAVRPLGAVLWGARSLWCERGSGGHRAARGSAAISILLALVLLQVVVAAALLTGTRQADISQRALAGVRAQYAADGAMAMSLREVYANVDEDADGSIGGISQDGVTTSDPVIGFAQAAATATTAGNDTTITINSRSAASSSRRVSTVVRSVASASGLTPGLLVEGWTLASGPGSLNNVNWASTPAMIGTAIEVNMPNQGSQRRWTGGPNNRWALRFTGTITVPTTGLYTFATASDDGSDLWINGARIVNNDGDHSWQTRTGTVTLTAGSHAFVARVYENGGGSGIIAYWTLPGSGSSVQIPASAFTFDATTLAHGVGHAAINIAGDSSVTTAIVDAYDSANGPYGGSNVLTSGGVVATNATTAGAFQLSAMAQIRGNAGVGVGANPASVITASGGATITGISTAQASRSGLTQATPPTLPNLGAFSGSGTFTANSNRRYDSFSLSGANSTFTVNGDVTIVVTSAVSLSDNARIIITPGSRLYLYIGTNCTLASTSSINAGGSPSQCYIFQTGNSSVFTLQDQASATAHLRSWSGRANLTGSGSGSNFMGTVRVNQLDMSGKAGLHLDIGGGGSSGGVTRSILSWTDEQ